MALQGFVATLSSWPQLPQGSSHPWLVEAALSVFLSSHSRKSLLSQQSMVTGCTQIPLEPVPGTDRILANRTTL